MKLIITDIDQTITAQGLDLWYEMSLELVKDKDLFQKKFLRFKQVAMRDPIGESVKLMKETIEMIGYIERVDLRDKIIGLVNSHYDQGNIREEALEFLDKFLQTGGHVVLSTANYVEGAYAFRKFLMRLFGEQYGNQIHCSGTIIDWDFLEVDHINVARNKVLDVKALFDAKDFDKDQIIGIFGDDPVVNDIALFNIDHTKSYLIETVGNSKVEIPVTLKRRGWDQAIEDLL